MSATRPQNTAISSISRALVVGSSCCCHPVVSATASGLLAVPRLKAVISSPLEADLIHFLHGLAPLAVVFMTVRYVKDDIVAGCMSLIFDRQRCT